MGQMNIAYKILVAKLERKRALGRPKHKWEDIILISQKLDVG
jgi:hypothetical protein